MEDVITETSTGMVLEIQRLSTEDGPGIRSTVFMKGCSLHCLWCHNPESISIKPQLQWFSARCIGCKTCLSVCPNMALSMDADGIHIDRTRCRGCGGCASACPANALEILGREWSAGELAAELLKDRVFFEKSEGGVTFSGGEATLQPAFTTEVMRLLKQEGIHIALDTCGLTSRKALEMLFPFVDLVLYDLKQMDPERHEELTGGALARILESLQFIADTARERGQPAEIWIRTPIIPGATDDVENIRLIGKYIRENCADVVTRWDLLAFNNLCRDKYERLGMQWAFNDSPLILPERKELLLQTACASVPHPEIVLWNGNTSLTEEECSLDDLPLRATHSCC